jgi:hypothetical protein
MIVRPARWLRLASPRPKEKMEPPTDFGVPNGSKSKKVRRGRPVGPSTKEIVMKFIATFVLAGLIGMTAGARAADDKAAAAPAGAAAAGAAAGGDDAATQYKAKTVYDFEDDMVEGDLQRPDGELVNGLKKTEHSSLIEIRKDFIPEMLKSLEDI